MSGDLYPRRRLLSPLDGYEEEEIDGKKSREKYLAYKEELRKKAHEKFEEAYRDWDVPYLNDPRTRTPRWEMTKEEELHWRSLQRDFTKDEKKRGVYNHKRPRSRRTSGSQQSTKEM
ncbi:hypothetical protein GCK72_022338 [Caenorhabditis remanei]|uniref:Uncharacterized protein n=1 Tax=Caenorhabditis remanei TaxID=31234 RepID=A0A6A5FU33_CAERE|nr:hypothetical protein GCK72_022338 [Caenorhabditis remanei]KAF1745891.1 hypothetical protein GCK72_022338 [Caenorhabditis remanei]